MTRVLGPAPRILSVLAVAIATQGTAFAGGLDFDLVGARAIGRAGTTTVSGDGGAALITNPAGMARSSSLRLQIGASLHDDDARFRGPAETESPTVADRSSPVLAPSAALQGALGPVVLGAALLELGHLERLLPTPAFGQPPEEVERFFPHRYGGLQLSYRRRVAVAGAALRVGEWLGLGLSAGGSSIEVRELRRIWAGFGGRDDLGSPTRDLDLAMSARDRLVPFATAGLLAAPPSLPVELAASLSWSADAFLDGVVAVTRTSDARYPEPMTDGAVAAELRLGMPITLRTGARYLGDRFLVEVGADLTWLRTAGKLPTWRASGAAVLDETGEVGAIDNVPSLLAQRNHSALRAAVDFQIVPGLLWLTGGYARTSGGTGRAHISPGFGDVAGHTVSLGAEGTWNQITFALGLARRVSPSVTVATGESEVEMQNPFPGGTASAGEGRHGRAHDAVGLTIEVAWE